MSKNMHIDNKQLIDTNMQNSAFVDLLKVVEVKSDSVTIPANEGKNVGVPKTTIEGYKYLSTLSAIPNGQANIICHTNGWAANPSSKPYTISVTYSMLFIKNL